MKIIQRANNWQQFATIAALSLLPAFAAYSSESNHTAGSQDAPQATTVAAAEGHASHNEGGHDESGHGEAAGGHDDKHEAHEHEENFTWGHPAKAADADRTVNIEAVDIAFKPTSVDVKKGETIKFVVTNTGKLEHEFALATPEGQKEHAKEMKAMAAEGGKMDHSDPNALTIPPGESKTLTWTFTKSVPVAFACHVPGHYEAGMRGDVEIQ